jgi:hypothetical protein
MAAKVATDLKRMQRFYGVPGNGDIAAYQEELIELMRVGYLGTVTYGFRRSGLWIEPTLRYTSRDLKYGSAADDDPGRIRPGADVEGASFYSYLSYSSAWISLSANEREAFEERLPFRRSGAPEPPISGYLHSDRTYSAGGRALERASVRAL